jgi:hippurate hydrolase
MLRTELDALPVTENTGLPFASTVRTKDDAGADVGVMHACGHDIHMASWVGTARIMAGNRGQWRGTLVLIGQPAEEIVSGAQAKFSPCASSCPQAGRSNESTAGWGCLICESR